MEIDVRMVLRLVNNYEAVLRSGGGGKDVLELWDVGVKPELVRLGQVRDGLLDLLAEGREEI